MDVTEHLDVDAKSFFDKLGDALLEDITRARGKKAKRSNLHAGYSYKKQLRGKNDPAHAATVRFVEYDAPRIVRSTVTTTQGVNSMAYEVAEIPEENGGGIDVTYTEEFEGDSSFKDIVQRGIGAIRSLGAKGRIREQLHSIERAIKADRLDEDSDEG